MLSLCFALNTTFLFLYVGLRIHTVMQDEHQRTEMLTSILARKSSVCYYQERRNKMQNWGFAYCTSDVTDRLH
jgi:hypothetical protein